MPVYSHSRLETYQNCPRHYKLRYIDKPDVPEYQGIEAFLGSRVHEALEKLYRDLMLSKLNSLEDLTKYYQWAWEKEWNEQVRIVRQGFTKKHYYDTGLKAIEKYYQRYQPFDQAVTTATEQMINIDVDGYSLVGFIDRLAHNGKGIYEVHDYKTGGRLPDQKYFDQARQLALYSIGVRNNYKDAKEVRLVWHYLVFDQEFVSERSEAQLKELKKDLVSLIKTIEKDEQFKPIESKLCDWCDYQDYCPAKTHQIKVDALPPNKYLKEPGVVLVNKYAELQGQISELNQQVRAIKDEQEKVAQAAIEYAKKEGAAKLVGSDACLKIEHFHGYRFPQAQEKGRLALEEFIQKEGLWEDISSLNLRAVSELAESDELDPDIRKELIKFAQKEDGYNVRLFKKKE